MAVQRALNNTLFAYVMSCKCNVRYFKIKGKKLAAASLTQLTIQAWCCDFILFLF